MIAVPVLTQRQCEALVASALRDAADNCLSMERNSACYGYSRVDAAFASAVPDDFFAAPADRTELTPLVKLQTGAMNQATGEWGVALMNVQANLPDTLPGQGVVFVLFGNTTVEDATTANAARNLYPIAVTTTANTNFRSGPGLNYNVVMIAEQGATLMADGISPDRKWLRVAYQDEPGWVHYTLAKTDGDMTALPVVDTMHYSPMQAFYLTTGLGQSACMEAPDVLLIQGPENYEITLSVNGAILEMGSTVLFRTIEKEGQPHLEITVLDGSVTLAPDINNPHPVIIPEGTRSTACLDTSGENPVVACRWSEPRASLSANWCSLEGIPAELLHYPVRADCSPPTPVVNINSSSAAPSEVLAEEARQGDDIPAVDSVFSSVSPVGNDGDCGRFGLLRGGETMISQFAWTALSGADEYKLNLYGADGQIVASRWFTAPTTSVTLNIVDFPTGGSFQWEVEALLDGQVLCYTPRSAMTQRPGNPNPSAASGTDFSVSCTQTGFAPLTISLSWSNAAAGDVVTINMTDANSIIYSTVGFGASGTITVVGGGFGLSQVSVSTSSGKSAVLGGC